jgi:RNA polymerase sigma-70 factor, ECF subfamily
MEVAGIYKEFHQALLSFIRSKVRSAEDAEDILQNVFIKISGNVNTLSAKEKLRSWIFTITRNAIIDYYRLNATRRNISIDETLEGSLSENPDEDPVKGMDQCVHSMIRLLPEEYRDVIIESEINGIKQKDLAGKYGIAYPSVRSKVQRGRERLKQLFYNCCHIEADKFGNVMDTQKRDGCGEACAPSCAEPNK